MRILPRSGRIALGAAVAALFGRTAGAVALDQEQFGLGRIAFLAVGQLARQIGDVESAFAARQLARLARRLAGGGRLIGFGHHPFGFGRMLLEPLLQAVGDNRLDHRTDFGGDQFVLGLGGEFGIRHLDREDAGQALARVVTGQRHFFLLRDTTFLGIGVDQARQGAAKAGKCVPPSRCGMLLVKHSMVSW